MMKRWAVGHIDFYNNDLVIEIVEAVDWQAALRCHSKLGEMSELAECADLETAKVEAFNQDSMIDVVEIADRDAGEVWHP